MDSITVRGHFSVFLCQHIFLVDVHNAKYETGFFITRFVSVEPPFGLIWINAHQNFFVWNLGEVALLWSYSSKSLQSKRSGWNCLVWFKGEPVNIKYLSIRHDLAWKADADPRRIFLPMNDLTFKWSAPEKTGWVQNFSRLRSNTPLIFVNLNRALTQQTFFVYFRNFYLVSFSNYQIRGISLGTWSAQGDSTAKEFFASVWDCAMVDVENLGDHHRIQTLMVLVSLFPLTV